MLENITPVPGTSLPKCSVSVNRQVVELIDIVKPQAIELKNYASTVSGPDIIHLL